MNGDAKLLSLDDLGLSVTEEVSEFGAEIGNFRCNANGILTLDNDISAVCVKRDIVCYSSDYLICVMEE